MNLSSTLTGALLGAKITHLNKKWFLSTRNHISTDYIKISHSFTWIYFEDFVFFSVDFLSLSPLSLTLFQHSWQHSFHTKKSHRGTDKDFSKINFINLWKDYLFPFTQIFLDIGWLISLCILYFHTNEVSFEVPIPL